jgi:hypothetical protein
MHEVLIFLTGLVIVGSGWRALAMTRDVFAPAVVFAPMLLYMFAYLPWTRLESSDIVILFPDREVLDIVFLAFFSGVTAFCIGLSWGHVSRRLPDRRFELLPNGLSIPARRKLFRLACLLGITANAAFWFMIYYSGGWKKVFSIAKPFLSAPSGYVGELPMLVYPAMIMAAVAWQGSRLTPPRILLLVLLAFPQVIMATFGGRRGPMFLVVCTFVGCWCIVHSRRPKLATMAVGIVLLGLLMMLLGGNRGDLFRPWENEVDFTVVRDRLTATDDLSVGDEFVAGCAMIIGSNELGRHYWGLRYVTQFVVRPIPSEIWPTKYHDMGMGWMRDMPGSSGIYDSEWISMLNFVPAGGNAGGFIPDLFLEFSWGMVLFCFLIGRLYSEAWKRWRVRGGLWVLLYFELLILSVYLPSQSVGAWLYRMMLLGLPTWLIWKKVIVPSGRAHRSRMISRPAIETTRL